MIAKIRDVLIDLYGNDAGNDAFERVQKILHDYNVGLPSRLDALNQCDAILITYPELHLFTIAALIVLGRYTGYRLTELWRFRDIVKPQA